MAILDPSTPQERADGVAELHQKTVRFLRKRGLEMNVPLTKTEFDKVIDDVWQALEGVDYRKLISGRMSAVLPEALVFFIFAEIVGKRRDLLVSKLPPRTGA